MIADRVLKQNDLLPALTIVCADGIGPIDLDGATALFRMVNVRTGTVKVNAAAAVLPDPSFTVSGATLSSPAHGLSNGARVTLKTSGTLPGNFTASISYWVVNATLNTLQLSLTEGGTPITAASAGSGTHTLLAGRVVYEWQGTDTDTAGTYFAEVQVTLASKTLSFPNDRQMTIEVVSDLV